MITSTLGDPELVGTTPLAPRELEATVFMPTQIGRHVVVDRLGAGGMGVVFAAYDPELDRRLAIKLLHPGTREDALLAQERVRDEARALARLAHPNVVAIYDVGTFTELTQRETGAAAEERVAVYIAMELVEGVTWSRWVGAHPRSWREVLAKLGEVGLALAAAHGAQLVHRDVKPDNVMVGDDARVRVMDFGLAQIGGGTPGTGDAHDDDARASGKRTQPSMRGQLVGTPAYMAPEQLLGLPADARSDQFALCVMLFEALYGMRPFAGTSVLQLSVAVNEGQVQNPPPERRRAVPAFVHRAVLRGLAVDPAARFPDVSALLAALADDPRRPRRVLGTLAAIAGIAIATVASIGGWRAHVLSSCLDEGTRAPSSWRAASPDVQAALASAGASDESWARLDDVVTRWSSQWQQAREQACTSPPTRPAERTAQLRCLGEQHGALLGLVTALQAADARAAERAIGSAWALPSPSRCSEPAWLAIEADLDEPRALARSEQREQLAQAQAIARLGRAQPALELARTVLADARAQDDATLEVEAELAVGSWAEEARQSVLGEAQLALAYHGAIAIGRDDLALAAATRLVTVAGLDLARAADADRWSRDALALLERTGEQAGVAAARLARARGQLARRRGELADALALCEQSLALFEGSFGAHDPRVADALDDLGDVLVDLDDPRSIPTILRALEIRVEVFGASHPLIAETRIGLANAYWDRGDLDRAAVQIESACAGLRESRGAFDPRLSAALDNLGQIEIERGHYGAARLALEEALRIGERVHPDHPDLGITLFALARLARDEGDHAQARVLFERTLDAFERGFGPRHPHIATVNRMLGNLAFAAGDLGRAIELDRRALALSRELGGEHSMDTAEGQHELGIALRDLGLLDEAEAELRAAERTMTAILGEEHTSLARLRVDLTDALLAHGELRVARELVGTAIAALEHGLGVDHPELTHAYETRAAIDLAVGDDEAAASGYLHVLAIGEKAWGLDHPSLAYALTGLGQVRLVQHRFDEADEVLTRAWTLRDRDDADPVERADTAFALARARWADPRRRTDARALATRAHDDYAIAQAGRARAAERAVAEWRRSHR